MAPFLRMPRVRKPDPLAGTIEKDETYTAFLEALTSDPEKLPSAEEWLRQKEEADAEAAKNGREQTPLQLFLREKQLQRIKVGPTFPSSLRPFAPHSLAKRVHLAWISCRGVMGPRLPLTPPPPPGPPAAGARTNRRKEKSSARPRGGAAAAAQWWAILGQIVDGARNRGGGRGAEEKGWPEVGSGPSGQRLELRKVIQADVLWGAGKTHSVSKLSPPW